MNEAPSCDITDPAQLEAWFGNFGHWEHWRKVVLASAYEIERAKNPKASESRLKELARVNGNYISFLKDGLFGRIARERNVRSSLRGGYR